MKYFPCIASHFAWRCWERENGCARCTVCRFLTHKAIAVKAFRGKQQIKRIAWIRCEELLNACRKAKKKMKIEALTTGFATHHYLYFMHSRTSMMVFARMQTHTHTPNVHSIESKFIPLSCRGRWRKSTRMTTQSIINALMLATTFRRADAPKITLKIIIPQSSAKPAVQCLLYRKRPILGRCANQKWCFSTVEAEKIIFFFCEKIIVSAAWISSAILDRLEWVLQRYYFKNELPSRFPRNRFFFFFDFRSPENHFRSKKKKMF